MIKRTCTCPSTYTYSDTVGGKPKTVKLKNPHAWHEALYA